MNLMKKAYFKGIQAVGEPGALHKDWRWLLLWCLVCYTVVLVFRLSFADRWNHPELWVNGERILATHDAYFWLAKAKGLGMLEGYPLAEATHFFHTITGIELGAIGFYAPAFLGALVGVVCAAWGWMLGGRPAAILAGLVGSLTPGFFYRTRLGYFDTDLFTLLAPLLIAAMLACICKKCLKTGWLVGNEHPKGDSFPARFYAEALMFGLVARFSGMWHFDILNISMLYFLLGLFLLGVNGEAKRRIHGFLALAIYGLAAFPGAFMGTRVADWLSFIGDPTLVGVISAFLLMLFAIYSNKKNGQLVQNSWLALAVVGLVSVVTFYEQPQLVGVLDKIYAYMAPIDLQVGERVEQTGEVAFPSILQSIIEAKKISVSAVLERGAIFPWLGVFAIIASGIVVCLRPVSVFLMPLIFIHFLSTDAGVRFTMFGGASLIIMSSVVFAWTGRFICKRLNASRLINYGLQMALATILLTSVYLNYAKLPLTPVIPKLHAEALIELADSVPSGSVVWTWWDWGYATQYFAGLKTIADGGEHAGKDIYPLAFAMTTDSPDKSASMIRFAAQHPSLNDRGGTSVSEIWKDIPPSEINAALAQALETKDLPAVSPQYIVVTWKDLTLSKWITYFGNWNLADSTSRAAKIRSFKPGELGFNLEQGAIKARTGQGGLVSSIAVLGEGTVDAREYFMNTLARQLIPVTNHLFINAVSRQAVLMDRIGQRSMMAQLLTGDPDSPEIAPHFKLVVDKLPFARVYEVVQ